MSYALCSCESVGVVVGLRVLSINLMTDFILSWNAITPLLHVIVNVFFHSPFNNFTIASLMIWKHSSWPSLIISKIFSLKFQFFFSFSANDFNFTNDTSVNQKVRCKKKEIQEMLSSDPTRYYAFNYHLKPETSSNKQFNLINPLWQTKNVKKRRRA